MADMFSSKPVAPLAEALRPQNLDEVVGQSHLLGASRCVWPFCQAKRIR